MEFESYQLNNDDNKKYLRLDKILVDDEIYIKISNSNYDNPKQGSVMYFSKSDSIDIVEYILSTVLENCEDAWDVLYNIIDNITHEDI